MISRRNFLKLSAGGAAAVGLYTWRIEPHWLEIVDRRLPVANLPRDLAGARLVQLSDIHIGRQVADSFLLKSFDRVRALAPEFVVFTGDFISYTPGIFSHAADILPHFPQGTRATVGILGNHDYGYGWNQPAIAADVTRLASAAGIHVLRNETAEAGGLHFVGLDDLWAGRFNPRAAFAGLPPGAAAIALSHNPDTADGFGWDDFPGWILSGHTHGGQCKPPFLPPPLLPVANRRYVAGEYALSGRRHMYISRGVGHLLAVRFNVRPEITVFHLERA